MKATDANLLELLRKGTQFVVPIYQRVYSWGDSECGRLWSDILHAGISDRLVSHFTGSIVYVERDEGTRTSSEPDLIIDGQQRVTTVMLLLAALADHLEALPPDGREPVEGFSPKKIRHRYLTNDDEDGDLFFKLVLSKSDKPALQAVLGRTPPPNGSHSRVLTNVRFFRELLEQPDLDLVSLCNGLKKLMVVDVRLARGTDDPQLVFETMNSTGKKLSQADLIRNFVLMDLPPREQNDLYEHFWFPMEQRFTDAEEGRFDDFVRHFLTSRTRDPIRRDDIYDAFKSYAEALEKLGVSRRALVEELYENAGWFAAMALGQEKRPRLARAFHDLDQLRATVVFPFLLRVYADFAAQTITEDEFLEILGMTITYLFRRALCQIPTNTLRSTFAVLAGAIDPTDYVASVAARYLGLPFKQRLPRDEEFRQHLQTSNLYSFPRMRYFLRKMENDGRKEEVSIADYSIEHIMPQNDNLSEAWKTELGDEWARIHDERLHTLGNLTLTGYNSEYSDRPFARKRDMDGGFRQSPLRLNAGIGELERWDEAAMIARGDELAARAIGLWPMPQMDAESLELHQQRYRERRGADWQVLHRILEQMPAGRWTSYALLAEAVGTAAQPLANHLARCTDCVDAYRVLRADGRVAPGFRWTSSDDDRDPREVLVAEGVTFDGAVADPEQRLEVEDLLGLLGE